MTCACSDRRSCCSTVTRLLYSAGLLLDDNTRLLCSTVIVFETLRKSAMEGFSWFTFMGFLFLTFNSGMAVYRSNGELGSVLFVVFSYSDLVLLFLCLHWYERAERESRKREVLKAAVWCLTTFLTFMFSYKVAELMPMVVKVIVWAMAVATSCGGFYAFFVYNEKAAAAAATAAASNDP